MDQTDKNVNGMMDFTWEIHMGNHHFYSGYMENRQFLWILPGKLMKITMNLWEHWSHWGSTQKYPEFPLQSGEDVQFPYVSIQNLGMGQKLL
jgi:hypothetical protein